MGSSVGGAVAAARMRKERQLVAFLRSEAAVSPAAAKPLEAQRGLGQAALRGLVRNGAVIEAGPAGYYLDEAAYTAMRSRRQRRIALVVLVAFGILAAVAALTLGRA